MLKRRCSTFQKEDSVLVGSDTMPLLQSSLSDRHAASVKCQSVILYSSL